VTGCIGSHNELFLFLLEIQQLVGVSEMLGSLIMYFQPKDSTDLAVSVGWIAFSILNLKSGL